MAPLAWCPGFPTGNAGRGGPPGPAPPTLPLPARQVCALPLGPWRAGTRLSPRPRAGTHAAPWRRETEWNGRGWGEFRPQERLPRGAGRGAPVGAKGGWQGLAGPSPTVCPRPRPASQPGRLPPGGWNSRETRHHCGGESDRSCDPAPDGGALALWGDVPRNQKGGDTGPAPNRSQTPGQLGDI